MKKRQILIIAGFLTVFTMLFAPFAVAETGSLAVWENIADGSLVCTWVETSDSVWTADNDSGIYKYNCTGAAYNVTINATSIGDRWFQTFEVLTSDPTHGISVIQTNDTTAPTTTFYAMEYYISHAGVNPEAYIVYHDEGTNYYWDTSKDTWDANVSNATDYSGDSEIDFYSGETFARVKAQWNWADNDTDGDDYNCTARFKIWLENGDEPRTWMIDDAFTMYSGTTDQEYYPGVGANHTHIGSGTTTFRRLFFWNLSWDLDTTCHDLGDEIPYIGVPQYDFAEMVDDVSDNSGLDYYNLTVGFRQLINMWDLTSFYNESYNGAVNGSQNDTVYIFSVMATGVEDAWEDWFGEEWDGDGVFPNNLLVFYVYNTLDGTVDEDEDDMSWDDNCRIRFDFDGDGYDSTDYTFLIDGVGTLFGYQGWTQVIPDSPVEWYGTCNYDFTSDDGNWGRMFRDDVFPEYVFYLNWDLISGETDAGECVNISISVYDNETSECAIWQDWDEQNDTQPKTASDNATWQESTWNTTTNWGIMYIEGGALDFDDPEEEATTPNYSETTSNLLDNVIPILIAVVALLVIIGMLFTVGVTIETLMATLVLVILLIVTLQIALGV